MCSTKARYFSILSSHGPAVFQAADPHFSRIPFNGDCLFNGIKKPQRRVIHGMDLDNILSRKERDILQFEGCTVAWQRALQKAGVTLNDLSFVETHDCFTVAELIEYEAMGLTPRGQGARAIKEGWTLKDGKLPVNPSGGLKAKGHPIGATGVSMHVMTAMQLAGQAPEGMQLPNAKLGGIFNMGGAAVANYVSILEPLK